MEWVRQADDGVERLVRVASESIINLRRAVNKLLSGDESKCLSIKIVKCELKVYKFLP